MSKIFLDNVSLTYYTYSSEVHALKDLSLKVNQGEFIGIVGPSGSGKSTLLSLVAGLLKPTKGNVYINGKEITGVSKEINYMLQQDYLFGWRTILENCLIGPEIQGLNINDAKKKVINLLETYGLKDFIHHYPNQLSGGMRQRVALVRTLATNPSILLLDEPFSALDYQTRLMIEDEVSTILRNEGKTVLLVTHDISEAIAMCDKIVVLSNRPAHIQAEHEVVFDRENLSNFKIRELPKFHEYFNTIWKELHKDDKVI
ncbi:NitT/TauT family transport system ATP-binding protein [Desulfonispora thiosulfatigenes DSM 11270]|uniref:NitT/TauT family transport system ATP-binding protein n=1 Tax=Desulfonispora thiosulfatigenes DSM 11270 TaxID=656914 RepID=A0A1W1VFV4_DESTI|nr:ABC transporter ATP-binding protein [Desulfonispora thiosulfatigenes]SMB92110.1 NitT/TauT family transport system ATP-binding protein [Desulfonispora thiosulfatigenes DSM 11270]